MKKISLLWLCFILLIFFRCSTSPTEPEKESINDGYGNYVFVPLGKFFMGDNFSESVEEQVHTVFLNSYYIGEYEVTNAEYKEFILDEGYADSLYWTAGYYGNWSLPAFWNDPRYKGGGIPDNENFPVIGISWYEAVAYCEWLSTKTNRIYRLPTEVEWEKAARGTDQRKYPWGNNFDFSYINVYDSSDPYDNGLSPAGFFNGDTLGGFFTRDNSSPFGAYDMAGNVFEWCYDWYSSSYYNECKDKGIVRNPQGPPSGENRIIRGSSWITINTGYGFEGSYARSSARPYERTAYTGFRCVRER